MELSNELKDNVIIFFDGSKKFITKKQAEVMFKESGSNKKGIVIDGNFISYSGVSKVITLKEYYQEYPAEKPPVYQNYVSPIKNPTKKGMKLMLQGLRKYCDENPEAKQTREFYNNVCKKYKNTGKFDLKEVYE